MKLSNVMLAAASRNIAVLSVVLFFSGVAVAQNIPPASANKVMSGCRLVNIENNYAASVRLAAPARPMAKRLLRHRQEE